MKCNESKTYNLTFISNLKVLVTKYVIQKEREGERQRERGNLVVVKRDDTLIV